MLKETRDQLGPAFIVLLVTSIKESQEQEIIGQQIIVMTKYRYRTGHFIESTCEA